MNAEKIQIYPDEIDENIKLFGEFVSIYKKDT